MPVNSISASTAQFPKLLDQLRDRIRLTHYSLRTGQAYAQWAKRYIIFHGKHHPADMGRSELGAFLTSLAVERNVAGYQELRPRHCNPSRIWCRLVI